MNTSKTFLLFIFCLFTFAALLHSCGSDSPVTSNPNNSCIRTCSYVSPAYDSIFIATRTASVNLVWRKASCNPQKYQWQLSLSHDSLFRNDGGTINNSDDTTGSALVDTSYLPYYWRIRGIYSYPLDPGDTTTFSTYRFYVH